MSRSLPTPSSARSERRGRWARRAAVLGGVAAVAACCSGNGNAFAPSQQAPAQRALRVQRRAVQESLDPTKIFEETKKKTEETIDSVVNAPTRVAEQANAAVDGVVTTLTQDDGKVLDAGSPAGAVGALTVSFAVLPYIPLSFYSSWLVATTGYGIEPGPYGIYGAAEGFATLVVLGMVLWSLTSFVTRARGLPDGPLSLLGVSQVLSWIAALLFAGATFLSGGNNINPFVEKREPAMPEATKKLKKEIEEIEKEPTNFFSGLTKSFDAQVEQAKKSVDKQLEGVKSQVSEKATTLSAEASKQVSKAAAPLKDQVEKAAKDVSTKAAAGVADIADKAKETATETASKAKETAASTAGKIAAKVPKVADYGDLLDD